MSPPVPLSIPDTERRLNVLVALPYMLTSTRELLAQHGHRLRLVIDSGAFTAWRSGEPITLDQYCRFIDTLPCRPWRYFTLDVIGDPAGTDRNYRELLKRGYNPVPIFTRGEDPSKLDELYETSDVVAIGGLVGTKGARGFVNGIMTHAKGRKVHWLGFVSPPFIRYWRPYMADSSSHTSGGQFGWLYTGDGNGNMQGFRRQHVVAGIPWVYHKQLVRYGIDPVAIRSEKAWRGQSSPIIQAGICSALDQSLIFQERTGTLVFMAVIKAPFLRQALDLYPRIEKLHREPIGRKDDGRGASGVERGAGLDDLPVLGETAIP